MKICNKITIKLTNVKDTGINYKAGNKYKLEAVNIQLFGPTSMMENTITYRETKEMYQGLRTFLRLIK